ncbi:AgmX/PglI C-terminal domain-containing protein [Corallococcus silvisoli]|uniref:AgmX/PglI C-terminal domain-containing protein n=1 Tax=Corallococcus silvisoli TaxID=2697031 RepID=UPI0013772233|nr:AgmX/PglI C-terminal domain-containing protein [Corallococcus silvisoli]NBD10366.1 AgmX/PglI C-terminal domain-containing protein [Corallococcus silvisoli]
MSELLTGDGLSHARVGGSDFSRDPDTFDAELDACLERALFTGPSQEDTDPAPESAASGPLGALLDLASTEASWLESLLPSNEDAEPALTLSAEAANVFIPEWLRAEAPTTSTRWMATSLHEASCGAVTEWDAAPRSNAWAAPGSPAEAYARQPWSPYAAPVEPEAPLPGFADASTRILGMGPLSFVSAVAMGALTAGLLVVAGLRLTSNTGSHAPITSSAPRALLAPVSAPSLEGATSPRSQAASTGTQLSGSLTQGTASVTDAQALSGTQVSGSFTQGSAASVADAQGRSGTQPASSLAQAIAGSVNTPALTDAQRAAQALTPNAPGLAGPANAGLTTGLRTLAPDTTPAAPTTKKKVAAAPRAETLEAPEDRGEVRELSFGGELSAEELAQARQAAEEAEAEEAAQPESEIDEDFARELGFTDDAQASQARASKQPQEKTVYIPPAPTSERERLTPADVTSVVVTNQPAIAACVQAFKAGTALEHGGRFQVRWSVDTSGAVSGVAMETEALRGSPLAGCIEDQVRGWKFPVHHAALEAPVRYPFVF